MQPVARKGEAAGISRPFRTIDQSIGRRSIMLCLPVCEARPQLKRDPACPCGGRCSTSCHTLYLASEPAFARAVTRRNFARFATTKRLSGSPPRHRHPRSHWIGPPRHGRNVNPPRARHPRWFAPAWRRILIRDMPPGFGEHADRSSGIAGAEGISHKMTMAPEVMHVPRQVRLQNHRRERVG